MNLPSFSLFFSTVDYNFETFDIIIIARNSLAGKGGEGEKRGEVKEKCGGI